MSLVEYIEPFTGDSVVLTIPIRRKYYSEKIAIVPIVGYNKRKLSSLRRKNYCVILVDIAKAYGLLCS